MGPNLINKYLTFLKSALGILIAPLFYAIAFLFLAPTSHEIFLDSLTIFLLCIALIVPFLLLRNRISYSILLGIIYLIVFLKLSFNLHYGVNLDSSALYVFFETNISESIDYLLYYFNPSILSLLILTIFIYILNLRHLNQINFFFSQRELLFTIGLLLLPVVGSHFILYKYAAKRSIIYGLGKEYRLYKNVRHLLQKELGTPLSKNIVIDSYKDAPETHVIIIGESTNRHHMQLYGYNRNTTPRLSEIQEELIVFSDVIAPNVHTITSLEKILTFSDYKNQKRTNNSSIVQLSNLANYKTFWISNQNPIGIHESLASIISTSSNERTFITTDHLKTKFDIELMPYIEKALNDSSTHKKVIFIHLMGTHTAYGKRYPEEFKQFTQKNPLSKFTHSKAVQIINQYDNAILYNDHIIREIIELVRKSDCSGTVTYFSDHGDEVYDSLDLYGHDAYHGSKSMYEVPFIIWTSEQYNNNNPNTYLWKNNTSKKYILEDYVHTFSDMLHLEYDTYNASKSIISNQFIEKKRIVKNGIDYEKK